MARESRKRDLLERADRWVGWRAVVGAGGESRD